MRSSHSHLTPNRAPDVVDSILLANLLGVIQRCGTVAVGNDEDIFCRENLESCRERRSDELSGFVLRSRLVSAYSSQIPRLLCVITCAELSPDRCRGTCLGKTHAWNEKCGIVDVVVWCGLSLGGLIWHWRFIFEQDQERSKSVTASR